MKKYFYTNGVEKFGPFSLEEMKTQNITRNTKIWFYGLDKWEPLKEIDELQFIYNSTPPPIAHSQNKKNITKKNFLLPTIIFTIIILLLSYSAFLHYKNEAIYKRIVASSYETNENFDFYVDKFYRDIEDYGIYPQKPKIRIIKFANLDELENMTDIHGLSFGKNDDEKIEIYINPSSWERFSKPMRYFLMYHELAHDILNLNDLKPSKENENKLMYPAIWTYEEKSMDNFIESFKACFNEISLKKN
jgi:hypothetical protein